MLWAADTPNGAALCAIVLSLAGHWRSMANLGS